MTAPLWTSADLAAATGGRASAPFEATGLSIDTRTLQPGDLFVALKDRRDGHDFVGDAFAAGASAALVSRPLEASGPCLVADDVLAALTEIAVVARARSGAVRCAVTGSVGKTSVKDMLARIFRAAGTAHWAEKSFNNHWGVPLTLARMPAGTERAVFEIGMSTPGEIAPRSRLVRPHHALITKIAPAHLEGVGSIEGVALEKSDIYAGLEHGGSVIIPADDRFAGFLAERGRALAPGAEVLGFGLADGAAARVLQIDCDGEGTSAVIEVLGTKVAVRVDAVGDHWALNAAAALLLAVRSGVDAGDACAALAGFAPPAGRGTAHRLFLPGGGSALLVDDAYNANPESMRAALAAFAQRPAARRIVALGEMLEIGAGSQAAHAELAGAVEASGASIALLAGEGMAALAEALPATIQVHHAVKADALPDRVKNLLIDGDALLIKGSNASGMGRLADALRQWSEGAALVETDHRPEGPAGGCGVI